MSGGVSTIDYMGMMRRALSGVMAEALSQVAEADEVPGDHHFYITFRTGHSGVVMPDWLRSQWPNDMTIVIQHEFGDLAVMADRFSVILSFSDQPVTLVIPFDAVTMFADPSVSFSLDMTLGGMALGEEEEKAEAEPEEASEPAAALPAPEGQGDDTVVSLDAFRKK